MSILATEGFDMYAGIGANTGVAARWSLGYYAGLSSISMVTGRFGGQAMHLQCSTNTGFPAAAQAPLFIGSPTSFSFGVAIEISNPGGAGQFLKVLNGSNSPIFSIGFSPSGQIQAFANGGLVGTSANAGLLPASVYCYLEAEVVLGSSGSINVYLNGQRIIALTGVNFGSTGSAVSLYFFAGNAGSQQVTVDDIYTTNVATREGESRIETLRPSANSSVQWTPASGTNYSEVNGTTVGSGYVYTTGVGNLDLYTVTALAETPSVISAVNVVTFATKTDAGTRAIYNVLSSGGVQVDGAEQFLAVGYGRFDNVQELDPNTSAAWAPTAVNAALIGPKLAA